MGFENILDNKVNISNTLILEKHPYTCEITRKIVDKPCWECDLPIKCKYKRGNTMEYVYIAMISGYEETKVLGVYTKVNKALEVAEATLKSRDIARHRIYHIAYVAKAKVDGELISYFVRNADNDIVEV